MECSKSVICVVNFIVLQWLIGGILSLNLFVGLLFLCGIVSSKLSLKVTNWRRRGTHFKICHNFVTFLRNLSWRKIVFLAVLHLSITRRISRYSERPKSFPTSVSPTNFPDIDTLHGFKCAPKII